MKWKNKASAKPPLCFAPWYVKEIIYFAYDEGYINYNTYIAAMEKIARNLNGDWMFKNGSKCSYRL